MNLKSIDTAPLLKNFHGDEEILLDMITAFQNGLDNLLTLIRDSIHNKDGDQLRINAHTFKGIMNSFYSPDGGKLASELEVSGQTQVFEHALIVLNELENLLVIFLYELQLLQKELTNLS